MYGLLWLAPFTWHNFFQVHPCYCSMHLFIITSSCQLLLHCMDIQYFVYSSVGRHLGCFSFLKIVNMLLWIFACKLLILLDRYLGVALLGSMVPLFNFWGCARQFCKVVVLFYIPTSKEWGFQSSPHHQHLLLLIFLL